LWLCWLLLPPPPPPQLLLLLLLAAAACCFCLELPLALFCSAPVI
jgi:hypothetical protein